MTNPASAQVRMEMEQDCTQQPIVVVGDNVVYDDTSGAAGAMRAPVSLELTLSGSLERAAAQDRLILREDANGPVIHAQYEGGRLWWMMPEGKAGKRAFELGTMATGSENMFFTENAGRYVCMEGPSPVLCYNFKTMPVPAGLEGNIFAIARSDYVHPIYGPDGEVLTEDFPSDHAHHRGLYWAWPEVMWQGETRDLHALGDVFQRPVKILRSEAGPVFASLEAENVWKWSDEQEIVREWATIRAFQSAGGNRVLDFSFRFEAIEPGVTIARRKTRGYGGLNLRLSPRTDQQISITPDPLKSWAELVGIPTRDGKSPVGITILQHPENPGFPGEWKDYAVINWLQPTFPSKYERYELKIGQPLILRFRLVVHAGSYDEAESNMLWNAYQTRSTESSIKHSEYE